MSNNNIEIFVLTYNRLELLKETILSLMNQILLDRIIINIVDNGSEIPVKLDDFTVAERVELNVYRFDLNTKLDIVFRKIGDLAELPYLMVFHDDDLILENYISECNKVIECEDNIIAIGCEFDSFFKTSNSDPSFLHRQIGNYNKLNKSDFSGYLYEGNSYHFGSTVYKTAIFKSSNLNINIYGKICDRPFVIDALDYGEIAVLKNKFVKYRLHELQDSADSFSGPYLFELINLEGLYFNILSKSTFANKLILFKNQFKYLYNNYNFLKLKKGISGSFFQFLNLSIKQKSTSLSSLFIGGIFFLYFNFRTRKT